MRTIQSELIEKGYTKSPKDNYSNTRMQNREKLSTKDWKELMGYNRDTYARGKGGAISKR